MVIATLSKPMKITTRYGLVYMSRPLLAALWLLAWPTFAEDAPDLSQIEKGVEREINAHRRATARPIFRSDAVVAEIARGHSKDMAKGKVGFGHEGLNLRVAQIQQSFALMGAAENVSKHQRNTDHAETAVRKWLESAIHRKNIDGNYDLSGIGAATGDDGTVYITQIFVKLRPE